MIYPTAAEWARWGINTDLEKLFLLGWAEMFDDATLDTWQVRTTNIRTVLQEIVRAVDVATEFAAYGHNVHELIKEADRIASLDPVVAKHAPLLRTYLKPYVDSADARKDLPQVRSMANVLLGHLGSYREQMVAEVEAALAGPPADKGALLQLVMAVGTELSVAGYTSAALSEGIKHLQSPGNPFGARVAELVARFPGELKEHACTFILNAPGFVSRLKPKGMAMTKGVPQGPLTPSEQAFFKQADPADTVVTVDVRAVDSRSARNEALQRLANLFAAVVAFEYDRSLGVKGGKCLIRLQGGPPEVLALNEAMAIHLASAKDSADKAARVVQLQATLRAEDAEQLNAALQYHRLALTAQTDEARLVNLWIALEILVRRRSDGSIIDSVCRYIPPSIALGNVYKLLRGLSIYVREYWGKTDPTPFLALFPKSNEKYLRPAELLDVLLDDANGPKINELLKLTDNVLLRYRLFRVKNRTLKSPESVAENLENHERNIDWQLRRIYRARNDVIHRARCPPETPRLLEHLHTYFVHTLNGLIHSMVTAGRAWSIPEALEHRRLLFDRYVALLKGKTSVTRAALLDPVEVLRAPEGRAAWPWAT